MRCNGVESMNALPGEDGSGSRSLRRKARKLDLPLPVRPQMATFDPAGMVRVILRRAGAVVLSVLGGVSFAWLLVVGGLRVMRGYIFQLNHTALRPLFEWDNILIVSVFWRHCFVERLEPGYSTDRSFEPSIEYDEAR